MNEIDQPQFLESPQPGRRMRPKLPQWPNVVLLVLLGTSLFGAGLLTGWYLWGNTPAVNTPPVVQNPTEPAIPVAAAPENTETKPDDSAGKIEIPKDITRYDVSREDLPFLGSADAPILLVEFSDYQCPYCKRWHDEVLSRLVAEYGDKIKFVYRNLPVIRANSADAAQASYCADEQGAYWEYHDALFTYAYGFDDQAYEQYARDLGLDVETLMECYRSGRYAATVDEDLQFARSLGIGSTPTFFLNGIPVVGAQPYDIFKQIIDLELAGQIP
jgi:protein-disulfide isomerase